VKPSDFFIGVLDFFAILLPGAAAAYLIAEQASARHWHSTLSGWSATAAFAMVAYVLGHLIFLLGAYLDSAYDRRMRRQRSWRDEGTYRAAAAIRAKRTPSLDGASFSTFKWCRAFVALHAPTAKQELEYYEATSKFFRSLVVLFALIAAALVASQMQQLPANRLVLAATAAVLGWLCFLRFCDQRSKLTELAYAYVVLIDATAPPNASSASSSATAADHG
jgi:hypothetical protein